MSKGKTGSLITELEQAKNNINQIISNLDNNLQSAQDRVTELARLKQNARDLEKADYNSASWFSKCVRTVSGLKYVFVTNEDKLPAKIIEENKNIFRSVDKNLINAANKSEPLAKILAQELDQTLNNLSDKKNLTPAQSQKLTELNEQFNKWATSQQSVKVFKHKEVASADPLQNQLSELNQIKNNMKQFLDKNASIAELARIAKEVEAVRESVPKTFFEKLSTPWKKVTSLFTSDSVTKLLKNTEQTTEQLAAITQRLERAGRNIESVLDLDTKIAQNKINKYTPAQSEVRNAQNRESLKRPASDRNTARESTLSNVRPEDPRENMPSLNNQNNARNSVGNARPESKSNLDSPRSSEYRGATSNVPQVEGRNHDVNLAQPQGSPRSSQMRSNEDSSRASESNFPLPPPPPPPPLATQSPRSSQFRSNTDENINQGLRGNADESAFAPPPPPPPPPAQYLKEPSSRESVDEKNPVASRSNLLEAIRGGAKLRNVPNPDDKTNKGEGGFNATLVDKAKNAKADDKRSFVNDSEWEAESSHRSNVNIKQDKNTPSRPSSDRHTQNENVTRASEGNLNTPPASPRGSQMQNNPNTSRPVSVSNAPDPEKNKFSFADALKNKFKNTNPDGQSR